VTRVADMYETEAEPRH